MNFKKICRILGAGGDGSEKRFTAERTRGDAEEVSNIAIDLTVFATRF